MTIIEVSDEASVIASLANIVEITARESIEATGSFSIGLSGGSLINYLATALPTIKTDWSAWKCYFCDERYVQFDDSDSTFGEYRKKLIPVTGLTEDSFVTINMNVAVSDCAAEYEATIKMNFGDGDDLPRFDMLLLGMGPDGHTCSLFPGHTLLEEKQKLVAPIEDSPKMPPQRVTMTLPLINNARVCVFAMSGSGKAEILKRVLKNKEPLPAALVEPTSGKLFWIVDHKAASLLQPIKM